MERRLTTVQPDPLRRAVICPAISFWVKCRHTTTGRLTFTLGLRGRRLKVRKFRYTAIRSANHLEDINLGQAALKALQAKITAAKRGSPKHWQSTHQMKYSKPLSNFNFINKYTKRNLMQACVFVGAAWQTVLRPNPPINRNCNSPLRGLPQSGYWQRWASEAAA